MVMHKLSEDLTTLYQLRPHDDNCQYKVLPRVIQEQLAAFAEEFSPELRGGKVQKITTLLREFSEVTLSAEHLRIRGTS